MKQIGSICIIPLLLVSTLLGLQNFLLSLEAQHIPHDWILIDGDEDFFNQAANESWPGGGTEDNPYIIENFDINRTSENGIEIRNTTVHFVIRNMIITDCDTIIKLQSVQNGFIENCILENSHDCIVLENSHNIHIEGNNITSNWDSAISLINSHNNTLIDNSFNDCRWGVSLYVSNDNLIFGNDFSKGWCGINIRNSNNNQMILNKLTYNEYGVSLSNSCNNVIENNTMDHNDDHGIFLIYSNNSIIAYNTLENNMRGIGIEYSNNNRVYENSMVDCGIILWGYEVWHWSDHNISTSNTVNSKPIYYLKNQNGGSVPQDAGQIILANCTNVTVEEHSISEVDIGIQLGHSTNNNIKNNSISSTNRGAIYIYNSEHNNFSCNKLFENRMAILTWYSNNNTFEHNEIKDNKYGIYIRYCSDNAIHNNTLENNREGGVCIPEFYYYSSNNSFFDNKFINDGFEIEVYYETNYNSYTIDKSNTVNGKPIYFWENKDAETIPSGAGQIILINCSNILIENQEIDNTTTGIKSSFSRRIRIINNKITDANKGICFSYNYWNIERSYHNIISENEIYSCYYGMYISDITHSNIINNAISYCEWSGINL